MSKPLCKFSLSVKNLKQFYNWALFKLQALHTIDMEQLLVSQHIIPVNHEALIISKTEMVDFEKTDPSKINTKGKSKIASILFQYWCQLMKIKPSLLWTTK